VRIDWSVRVTDDPAMNRLGLRAVALYVSGVIVLSCATTLPEASYKLYPGPARPDSDIVIVRLGDAGAAEFDGRVAVRSDWSEVRTLPGEHTIRWQTEFGVSVLVEPSGFATGGNEARVVLAAGHVYTLRAARTTGPGYRMYFWIRDDTTQQVVAGEPKP
jgi:hypothetical protein